MFDGSLPWSVGVGEGEWSWPALGAPKRLWSDGFVMIDGVFVVAVGVSAEEGGELPGGGGGAWCGFAAGWAFGVFWRATSGWLCFG